MKKLLFATTALVATVGMAQADLSLTGEAKFGLRSPATAINTADDVHLNGTIDFNIVGAGSTDNGLIFGASLDVDAGTQANPTDNTGNVSDLEAFISGGFGTLTVGQLAHANDAIGLADVGFDGVGVDDDVEKARNGANSNITYSHSVGGFGITLTGGLDFTPSDALDNMSLEGDVGIGVSYEAGAFKVAAAFDRDKHNLSGEAQTATGIRLDYNLSGFNIGVAYINGYRGDVFVAGTSAVEHTPRSSASETFTDSAGNSSTRNVITPAKTAATGLGADVVGYGLDVSYTIDALTLTAAFGVTDAKGYGILGLDGTNDIAATDAEAATEESADYGIGFAYDLGGGLSLNGGAASVNGETGWDLGIKMAF